jgi:hypothetical protein
VAKKCEIWERGDWGFAGALNPEPQARNARFGKEEIGASEAAPATTQRPEHIQKGAPYPYKSAKAPAIVGAMTLQMEDALSRYPMASPCIHLGASFERNDGGVLRRSERATAKIGTTPTTP